MDDERIRAMAGTAAKRSWFIQGWVILNNEGNELHSFIGDKNFYRISVDFDAPDGTETQFILFIPEDGVMKVQETGKDDNGRKEKKFWLYERTTIWQETLRPVRLGEIDLETWDLPAKLRYKDFAGGMEIQAIPAS